MKSERRPPMRLLDNPWKRVPPELAIACGVWLLFLLGFGAALEHHPPPPPQSTPKPIDARVVEVTPPPPPPKPKPKPVIPQPRHLPAAMPHRVAPPPPVPQTPSKDALPVATPKPLPSLPPAPPNAPVGGDSSALAIYNPTPQIPDELRDEPLDVVAVARFEVAADGSATVELVQPTPIGRLNQAILATLKTWKFYPAIEKGQPVASSLDIRVPIKIE